MKFRRRHSLAIVSAIALSFIWGNAAAQNEDVYEPDGIRLGGFTLFPTLRGAVLWTDNVYAQQSNQVDDIQFELSPELTLVSNWSRHELTLRATNKNVRYNTESSEDYSDWSFGGEARVDVSYATSLHMRAIYAALTEGRGDSNALGNAAEPTAYDRFDSFAELRHRFNRLGVALGAGVTEFDYDDVAAIGGGTIDNDNRDRTVTLARGELNYAVSPDTRVFVRGTYNWREYDQQPPAVALNRDSEGYQIDGGFRFDVTHLIEGEIYAGYLEQDYDVLADIDGLSYGASFNYDVTRLTTLRFEASRSVEETNQAASPGYLASGVRAEVRHELLRNVEVTAGASFQNNDYMASVREEDIWTADVGLEYIMNRSFVVELGYSFSTRDSTLPLADYDRNTVWVALTGRF